MKAIILARVSTEEQKEAGNSLPAQVARLKAYCDRKGFELVETFSFDESAYKTKRDEFDRVLEYLNANKEKIVLCFDKVDRLSRNVFDKRVSMLYEKAVADEIELHFVSDNQIIGPAMSAVEKFQFGMSLGLAKYYSDAISDNVKRVFELKRRNGDWTGKAPIGYKNIPLDEEQRLRKDIEIDDERGHLVQALFELWSSGLYSTTAIWKKITDMGLRNENGQKLARSNIVAILKNSFYCGIAHSKWGAYEHRYPRLISKALFDQCQEVFTKRAKKKSKVTLKEYIFQGLLPCAGCGCLYSPETHKGNNYYSCTNAKGTCKRTYVNEKELLKPIYEVFGRFASIPQDVQERLVDELRKLNETEARFYEKEFNRIQTEHQRVQGKVSRLTDALIDGSITKDIYDKKLEELKDQQYRLGIELEEHTKADHQYHIHVATVLNLCRRIRAIFDDPRSEVSEKRAILNFILQNPTVDGKKLVFTMRKPFDVVLELAECPNWLRDQDSNLEPYP
jgi:site-specific DNA recombinase